MNLKGITFSKRNQIQTYKYIYIYDKFNYENFKNR